MDLPPLLEEDPVFREAQVHEGFRNCFDHGWRPAQEAQSPLWVHVSPQLLICDSPAADKWLEVWVDICALLRDVEVAGELVRELPTRLDDGAFKEQLLGVLGAVAEVGGAYVVAPPARCLIEMQQICGVQQDGVQGIDPHAAGHQQEVHGGIRGRRVEEEVPADTHGYPGADCTHGVDPVCWRVFGVFDGQFDDTLPLQQTRAGAHGETPHLLHAGDEEIHPLSCFEGEVWMDGYSQTFHRL